MHLWYIDFFICLTVIVCTSLYCIESYYLIFSWRDTFTVPFRIYHGIFCNSSYYLSWRTSLLFYILSFSVGPYQQSSFALTFRPSSLTEIAETTVILSNSSYGESVFEVSGAGLLPGLMSSIKIFSPLGEIGSHTIAFRNPFPFPLPVDILLTCELVS